MAYEAKAGSFSLFKNDRKEKDTHPDYKGDGKDLDGNDVWVSAWIKEGSKGKFMSCSIQRKDASQSQPKPQPAQTATLNDDISDVPF